MRFKAVSWKPAASQRQQWLFALTQHELHGAADFSTTEPRFAYHGPLTDPGCYNMDWKQAEERGDHFYRTDHPLAQRLIEQALVRPVPLASLTFHYRESGTRISALDPFIGNSGWLQLSKLTVESFESEEFLLLTAYSDDGQLFDDEMCRRMLSIPATIDTAPPSSLGYMLEQLQEARVADLLHQVEARNATFFDEEVNKLDLWAEDLKVGLERELKELDRDLRDARKRSITAPTLAEKLEVQKEIRELEGKRNQKRRELYDAQDAIDRQRDDLIGRIEQQLRQRHVSQNLFSIRWLIK
jgi:adenine-specific DNA-methyltransferase